MEINIKESEFLLGEISSKATAINYGVDMLRETDNSDIESIKEIITEFEKMPDKLAHLVNSLKESLLYSKDRINS